MEFEYEEKQNLDKRRLLWVLVWVLLFTALIVVGSWLFKSSRRPEVEGEPLPGGTVTEAEIEPVRFTPEQPDAEHPRTRVTPDSELTQPPSPPPATAPPPAPPPEPETSPAKPPAPNPEPPPKPPAAAPPSAPSAYGLQVGAFSTRPNAQKVVKRLKQKGYDSTILQKDGMFKVVVTGFATRTEANGGKEPLARAGFPGAFTVELE